MALRTPHANTNTARTIHGIQARTIKPGRVPLELYAGCDIGRAAIVVVSLECGGAPDFFGFHTFKNNVRHAIEMIAAPTSTSIGPW